MAFEYGVDYNQGGTREPKECIPQSSDNYHGCDGKRWNVDLYLKKEDLAPTFMDYKVYEMSCVPGHNMAWRIPATEEECVEYCNSNSACKSFEFAVNHGGSGSSTFGGCRPQTSADWRNCDGKHYNTTLYIKP